MREETKTQTPCLPDSKHMPEEVSSRARTLAAARLRVILPLQQQQSHAREGEVLAGALGGAGLHQDRALERAHLLELSSLTIVLVLLPRRLRGDGVADAQLYLRLQNSRTLTHAQCILSTWNRSTLFIVTLTRHYFDTSSTLFDTNSTLIRQNR